jgi:hypothetical protein
MPEMAGSGHSRQGCYSKAYMIAPEKIATKIIGPKILPGTSAGMDFIVSKPVDRF